MTRVIEETILAIFLVIFAIWAVSYGVPKIAQPLKTTLERAANP